MLTLTRGCGWLARGSIPARQAAWGSAVTSRRELILGHAATLEWNHSKAMTPQSLRRQYHRLAKQHHPDRAGHVATTNMQDINAAFRFLFELVRKAGGRFSLQAMGTGGAELVLRSPCCESDIRAYIQRVDGANTEAELAVVLDSIFESAAGGWLECDNRLLVRVVNACGYVVPLGTDHTVLVIRTLKRWCVVFDVSPSLDVLHMVLEDYQAAYHGGKISGSVMSVCWPQIASYLQANCEPNDYTFLILRRMDPGVRI